MHCSAAWDIAVHLCDPKLWMTVSEGGREISQATSLGSGTKEHLQKAWLQDFLKWLSGLAGRSGVPDAAKGVHLSQRHCAGALAG